MGNGGQNFERRPQQSAGNSGGMGGGNMNSGNDMFSRRGQQPGGQNRNQNSGGFGNNNTDGNFGGPNFSQGMNR